MPIYEFTCGDCGLRFGQHFGKAQTTEELPSYPCKGCGKTAYRQVSTVNHAFRHPSSQVRGALPPNTGTSDDWNFDRAIGRDAESKWKVVEQRKSEKDRLIATERKEGRLVDNSHLVRKPDGDGYRVIQESERVEVNNRRTAAAAINNAIKDKEPSR